MLSEKELLSRAERWGTEDGNCRTMRFEHLERMKSAWQIGAYLRAYADAIDPPGSAKMRAARDTRAAMDWAMRP